MKLFESTPSDWPGDRAGKNKTARENPAPLRLVKSVGRSALANQRRGGRRRHVAAGPAYAELDVLRGQVVELERTAAAGENAVEGIALAGDGGAEIEIAIGQFDGEVLVDLVGKAGVSRPGEAGLVRRVGEIGCGVDGSDARAWNGAQILEPVDLVESAADASADERRNAPPGTEVDIDVGHCHPARETGAVNIRYRPETGNVGKIRAAEHRLGTIFAGD